MECENSKKEKRVRRSKKTIEDNLVSAAKTLIEEVGFNNVTISGIVRRAQVEPAVFYNRYKDLEDLFDKFVRTYDYWLNDTVNFDPINLSPMQNCENLLIGLVDSINSDKIMQKLLAWELNNDNYIIRRTSDNRERNSKSMIEYFDATFTDSELNIKVIAALLISGIYYLSMHKHLSTFCFIDFTTKESTALLKKNIHEIVKKIYLDSEPPNISKIKNDKALEIAKKLLENNVDYNIIKESTGLPDKLLKSLTINRINFY